jgi:tetratricopeptide (TPR) repeat protein
MLALLLPGGFATAAAAAAREDAAAEPREPAPTPTAERPPADPSQRLAEAVHRGNEARRQGRTREAIAAYRLAERLAPQQYEVRILLADTLRRSSHPDEAAAEYKAAARLDPHRPEAWVGRALLQRAVFDFQGAVDRIEAALPQVPATARRELLLTLGETRRRQGRLDQAQAIFAQLLQAAGPAGTGDAAALAGLAQVAEARGDLDGAVGSWQRALAIEPDDEEVLLRLQELRELRASIAALRVTAAATPSPPTLDELGRLQAIAGDERGAARSYRQALRLNAGDLEARRGLALALRDAGETTEAAVQFRRLLARSPGEPLALYSLAALARQAENPAAEEAAWIALLQAHPDDLRAARAFVDFAASRRGIDADLLGRSLGRLDLPAGAAPDRVVSVARLRALLLGAAGRMQEAGAALSLALRLDPTDPRTQEVAGDILRREPRLLSALGAAAEAALKQAGGGETPAGAASLALLAQLTAWSGHGGEGLILTRRAVVADPQSSIARSAAAAAYQEVGRDPQRAIEEMRRAVALDPSRLTAQVDLALALLHAGHPADAERAARSALQIRPGAAPLRALLGAALADQGQLEEAADSYAAALRADPADNLGLARGQYPMLLGALGRQVEARRALRGELPPIPDMIYGEAWRFARESWTGHAAPAPDWGSWRERYRGTLASAQDAYRAVAVMLASLGDPYTRLRDAEESAALYLTRHAGGVEVDRFGRNRSDSRTVTSGELEGGLGYIRISNFTDPRAVAELRQALAEMGKKEGIVLDLRGNPGGLVRNADAIGDLLVGPGKEAGVDLGAEGPETRRTGGEGALTDSPLVVLVDGQTASAAERLARTLEATGRGALIGEETYGKGRAQVTHVLPGGATVVVSMSEMLGPDGRPIQGRGLQPRMKTRADDPTGTEKTDDPAIDRARTLLRPAPPDDAPRR